MKQLSQNEYIGKYIHDLRIKNHMTLKQLSEKVDLSPGFLSQMERGYTTFSLNTLTALAEVFDADLSSFFAKPVELTREKYIARSYNRTNFRLSKEFEQYTLLSQLHSDKIVPEIYNIYPQRTDIETVVFSHAQEELMILLDGCLEVTVDKESFVLTPHDSIYIPPNTKHSWKNLTNNTVTLLGILINS